MPNSGRGSSADRAVMRDEQAGFAGGPASWCPGMRVDPPLELREDLARTIESEIIPRLMLAHRVSAAARPEAEVATPPAQLQFSAEDVERFCEIIVRRPLSAAREHVDGWRSRGMTLETVIGSVLSETARHLGRLWESDRCTFVDVTVGLSRLQQLLRIYGPSFEGDTGLAEPSPRILLASIPGEQHTFGLSVVEEYFRRAGWMVEVEIAATGTGLVERLGNEWFDVIGLSASGETALPAIAGLIGSLRTGSVNRELRVVMGGFLFNDNPELARDLGADGGARDANDGLIQVRNLIQTKKIAC